jgi:hypothetical protein
MTANQFAIVIMVAAWRNQVAALRVENQFLADRVAEFESEEIALDDDWVGKLQDEVEALRDIVNELQGVG